MIKTLLLGILVASLFAYIGLQVNLDLSTTYGVATSDAGTNETFGDVQAKAGEVSGKVQQVNTWLQSLTEGNLLGFVYAMPTNIANILGIFLTLPNLAYSIFDATLSSFGVPSFVTGIISVMLIVTVVLIIVGIWTEGRV